MRAPVVRNCYEAGDCAGAITELTRVSKTLADRAHSFNSLAGSSYAAMQPFLLRNPETLAAAVSDYPEVDAAALWEVLSGDTENRRAALDVALIRALSPLQALATIPFEACFQSYEADLLRSSAAAAKSPVRPVNLLQVVGQPLDYEGYLCTILKPTRACNLRCSYCHDWASGSVKPLPFATELRFMEQIVGASGAGVVDLVWHGGEPTLLGWRKFLRLMVLQDVFRRPGQAIRNMLQTNGTTITREWLSFLTLFRFQVSVSLDGCRETHDRWRKTTSGKGTYATVMQAIGRLRESGVLSGILCVLDDESMDAGPEELLRFLDGAGITEVGLNPRHPSGETVAIDSGASEKAYIQFLSDLVRARKRMGLEHIKVREVDACGDTLRCKPAGWCEVAGNCVGAFVMIDSGGDVWHCDKFWPDDRYLLGNLLQEEMRAILGGPKVTSLRAEAAQSVAAHQDCRYFALCQGWCPHRRYLKQRRGSDAGSCCGLSALFETWEQAGLDSPHGTESNCIH